MAIDQFSSSDENKTLMKLNLRLNHLILYLGTHRVYTITEGYIVNLTLTFLHYEYSYEITSMRVAKILTINAPRIRWFGFRLIKKNLQNCFFDYILTICFPFLFDTYSIVVRAVAAMFSS
ncbi:hypothetical protein ACJX0J_036264 [Zea mays]